ncbi:hypothetical protein Cgig2_021390 [Carnegiea gigantea]|uniref:BZIP domain-containing protein n=1 Tax=Carnegiea gigantea TaxID=171969 RepID=A0A9Q1GXT1_9CARY|nr:hypothetical protein Cgig2_021390 [Carnegiea gigantea]
MDAPTPNICNSSNTNAKSTNNNDNQEALIPPRNYAAPAASDHMDAKRLRRLLMNREYAQRCHLKKQEYTQELLRASNVEEAKIAMLSLQVSVYKSQKEMLETENAALRQKIQEMEARACIDDCNSNFAAEMGEGEVEVHPDDAAAVAQICWYFTDSWDQFRINGMVDVIDGSNPDPAKLQFSVKACLFSNDSSGKPLPEHEKDKLSNVMQQRDKSWFASSVDYLNVKTNTRKVFECSGSLNGDRCWTSGRINP